jgi:hypothetical protein
MIEEDAMKMEDEAAPAAPHVRQAERERPPMWKILRLGSSYGFYEVTEGRENRYTMELTGTTQERR